MIAGITRVRNESLIIDDTLEHFLNLCDHIFIYDDCSTDDTVNRCLAFGDRVSVIRGDVWKSDRKYENTRHRGLLLDIVKWQEYDWVLCFDADERLVGKWPDMKADGYKFRLFDGYLTPENSEPYKSGPLEDLPRMWGPECREILMLFRPEKASYRVTGQREPIMKGDVEVCDIRVKHYGKCLSVEHWEETCDYYANNFPEPFKSKWSARRGNAIHTKSDFGKTLYKWGDL